jgi:hypothetical protein
VKLKLTTRNLGVVVGIAILLYAAAGYFMVVSPKKSEAVRLDEEIVSTQADLRTALATTAAQADMPGVLLELQRIADETGIRFKSITPQTALPVAGYYVVPIDVAFDGSFYALSDFLFRLRTLVTVRRGELHAAGRLFSVTSVDFSEADSGFPLLAATLKLNAYVYGQSTVPPAVPPAATEPSTTTEGGEAPPPAGSEATGSEAAG